VPGQTGGDERADGEAPLAAILFGHGADRVLPLASGSVCGWKRGKRSTPSKLLAVHFGIGPCPASSMRSRADRRVVGAGLFADETGPHGVVEFWDM